MIIMSTVRTQFELLRQDFKYKLGFVGHSKRLNVAISRARALLVVLGNAGLLQADAEWRSLLCAIHQHGGFQGPKLDCFTATPVADAAPGAAVGSRRLSSRSPAWASLLEQPPRPEEGVEHDYEGECHDLPWRNDY